jgi:hypothetical protein
MLRTQLAHGTIPSSPRIASVLNELRRDLRERDEVFHLARRHVARAQRKHPSRCDERFHRAPCFVIVAPESFVHRRSVQHQTVDVLDTQVLERALERLRDLRRDRRARIEGQTVILSIEEGELRLKEELVARNAARCNAAPYPFFVVVLSLIGRVDPAKTGGQRLCDARRGRIFLPRSSIEKARDAHQT